MDSYADLYLLLHNSCYSYIEMCLCMSLWYTYNMVTTPCVFLICLCYIDVDFDIDGVAGWMGNNSV